MNYSIINKAILYIASGMMGYFMPMIPYLLVCIVAIIFDMVSAYDLSRRVAKVYQDKSKGGKLKSDDMKKIIPTIYKICMVIMLVHMVDTTVLNMANLYLTNIVAAIFCMVQIVSILENISSCSDERWAKILQKVLVDKTARHLNIDIEVDDLKETKKRKKGEKK